MRRAWLGCGAALLLAHDATAGTRIATATRHFATEAPRLERALIRVEGDRLRVDADAGRHAVIYRSDRGVVSLLDHVDRTYLEVNRGTTTEISRRLDRANEALRERIRALPPEQQPALEQLLESTLGPPPAAEPSLTSRATGRRDVVAGIPCEEVEVLRGGERKALVCSAAFEAAGIAPDTLDVVRELAAFLLESIAALAPKAIREEGVEALDAFGRTEGLPLRVRAWKKGELATETVVTEIATESFAAELFEVPAGYRGGFSLGEAEPAR